MEKYTLLLKKYLDNSLTMQEFEELMAWASSSPHFMSLLEDLSADAEINKQLLQDAESISQPIRKGQVSKRVNIAITSLAAGIIFFGFSYLVFNLFSNNTHQTPSTQLLAQSHQSLIKSGSAGANLIIPGKEPIHLTDTKGIRLTQEGIYSDQGNHILSFEQEIIPINFAIDVPKGAEFQVHLPDGSNVWLNADSKLTFPTGFGNFDRMVNLEGEGYFDIKQLENRPFRVHTQLQKIKVLGTSFNVKAYEQNGVTTTTLVEGKVEVEELKDRSKLTLSPGESLETKFGEEQIVLKKIDNINTHIAWQKGEFLFDHTPFEEVAQQIARWYNISLHVENNFPQEYFSGQISRETDFEVIVDFFKQSGIDCEVKGNVLIIR